ncbi:MAG: CPBP family intramembrane metalloprotease [Blautia sp.]|nr:CPBP family intramembrane metalloprotease [Lachnoclostridium sp.]MCM1211420.1 CPBP family intramembrane metalloprotease [Blautia sp.]
MERREQWSKQDKKQLAIFAIVNFGMTVIMGILMGISYRSGNAVEPFPAAQMMYPAAGVIIAFMVTMGKEKKLPYKFFITYLAVAAIAILLTVGSVIYPSAIWYAAQNYVFMIGSILAWIMLFCEKKDVRRNFFPHFEKRNIKGSFGLVFLFFVIYILRLLVAGLTDGSVGEVMAVLALPATWFMLVVVYINFYLTFIIFFGEEYGWRFFLQPILQKRFGLKGGVILLGVIWGLWHLPINVFYYSPDTWFYSILMHQITCISFSIFFGYAYKKTGNLWVPILIHYINNNMAVVITQSADLGNQVYRWQDVLFLLVINGICFVPFLFTKVFKEEERELPGKEADF